MRYDAWPFNGPFGVSDDERMPPHRKGWHNR
jgi:hypothetical protein